MISFRGVGKILAFNLPWYAAAAAVNVAGLIWLRDAGHRDGFGIVLAAAVALADFWMLASLAVSWYVYDLSPLSNGAWLDGVDPSGTGSLAIFHAGQDEATGPLALRMPGKPFLAFDFYAEGRNGTPSLLRARARNKAIAESIPADRIPMERGSLDAALVVFAAHEIRDEAARSAFFRELARVVADGGRIQVVEHLRDGWNLLAYGPGAFHFLGRRTWLQAFRDGGLRVARESACTPFVRVFALEKAR